MCVEQLTQCSSEINRDVETFTQLPCHASTGPNACVPSSAVSELNDVPMPAVLPRPPLTGMRRDGRKEWFPLMGQCTGLTP